MLSTLLLVIFGNHVKTSFNQAMSVKLRNGLALVVLSVKMNGCSITNSFNYTTIFFSFIRFSLIVLEGGFYLISQPIRMQISPKPHIFCMIDGTALGYGWLLWFSGK